MNRLDEAALYARFAWGLPRFLARRSSLEEALEVVRRRHAEREANLLCLFADSVYGHPSSPYLPLLRRAGCELGDLGAMLAADGVEATLGALHDAGVYVSFEEFKGRRPIVRGGHEQAVADRDFDSPRLHAGFTARSSGTTGRATRTFHDLDHVRDTVPFRLIGAEAHGVRTAPLALWLSSLPGVAGVNMALSSSVIGNPPERWFTPLERGAAQPFRQRVAVEAFVALCRAGGVRVPRPEPVPFDDPTPIVDWLVAALARHGRCELRAFASSAMRVARAATARGVDLTGAVFSCGGEATTPAKQAAIEACGARMVSFYAIAETGPVGFGCPRSADARDHHLSSDRLAVVARQVELAEFGFAVDGLFLTSLLPGAPKVMINVESDDCGRLSEPPGGAGCGCALERAGFRRRVHDVRSYRRLTAEGVTLVREPAARLIERLLPDRFGGSALDYQLCEEEGVDGQTRLTLRIDPAVGALDEPAAARELLAALSGQPGATALAAAFWRSAGTIQVRREAPLRTPAGKQLPIVVAALGARDGRHPPRGGAGEAEVAARLAAAGVSPKR